MCVCYLELSATCSSVSVSASVATLTFGIFVVVEPRTVWSPVDLLPLGFVLCSSKAVFDGVCAIPSCGWLDDVNWSDSREHYTVLGEMWTSADLSSSVLAEGESLEVEKVCCECSWTVNPGGTADH